MTVNELIAMLQKEPGHLHVAVWLPGSRIDLAGSAFTDHKARELLIEGNVRDGSALIEGPAEPDHKRGSYRRR